VGVVHEDYPWETSWKLYRVFADGTDQELVQSHNATSGGTSQDESICLQEGEYEFTIYDSDGDGINGDGIRGPGHYNIT